MKFYAINRKGEYGAAAIRGPWPNWPAIPASHSPDRFPPTPRSKGRSELPIGSSRRRSPENRGRIDAALLLELARSHSHLVTIEDGCVMGGAGSAVAECLNAHGLAVQVLQLGLPDRYLAHGSREEVLADAGLDLASIRARVLAFTGPRAASAAV